MNWLSTWLPFPTDQWWDIRTWPFIISLFKIYSIIS